MTPSSPLARSLPFVTRIALKYVDERNLLLFSFCTIADDFFLFLAQLPGRRRVQRSRRVRVPRLVDEEGRQQSVLDWRRLHVGLLRAVGREDEHLLQHGVLGSLRAVRVGRLPAKGRRSVRRWCLQGVRRIRHLSDAHDAVRREGDERHRSVSVQHS